MEMDTFLFCNPRYQTLLLHFGKMVSKLVFFTFLLVFGLDKRVSLRLVGVHRNGELRPMIEAAGKPSTRRPAMGRLNPIGKAEMFKNRRGRKIRKRRLFSEIGRFVAFFQELTQKTGKRGGRSDAAFVSIRFLHATFLYVKRELRRGDGQGKIPGKDEGKKDIRARRGVSGPTEQRHGRRRRFRRKRWAWPLDKGFRLGRSYTFYIGNSEGAWKTTIRPGLPGERELCDSGKPGFCFE